MKRTFIRMTILCVITIIIGLAVFVLPRNARVKKYLAARTVDRVLADYTDNTVLKTLAWVVDDVKALNSSALKLQADPTDENLAATAAAWRAARVHWSMTSAFMFGPGNFYDFDKQMATWPFDKILVDHLLGEIEAGKLQVDSAYLREKNSSMRGFYTAEYLLFRNGQPRKAKDVSAAELNYLAATTQAMLEESIDFEASWLGTANLPAAKAAVIQKAKMENRSSYAHEFKTAGRPGSRYFSPSVALEEIFQQSATVIEDIVPLLAELAESPGVGEKNYWVSKNANADVLNMLHGSENAYLGGVKGSRGHSISELVAAKNQMLDRRVKIAFAHTAHRIAALGGLNGRDREARELALKIAEMECNKLMSKLNFALLLVAMDPEVRPWAAYGQ